MKTKSFFFFFTFAIAVFVSVVSSSVDVQYQNCLQRLICGNELRFEGVTYPFWGRDFGRPEYCGIKEFELFCKDDGLSLTLKLNNVDFRIVTYNFENQSLKVAEHRGCLDGTLNFTGSNQFTLAPTTKMMELFNCHAPLPLVEPYPCDDGRTYYAFQSSDTLRNRNCEKVGEIPMTDSVYRAFEQSAVTLDVAIVTGFDLSYKLNEEKACHDCLSSGGICGSDTASRDFRCFCSDRPYNSTCPSEKDAGSNFQFKIVIGVVTGVVALIVGALIIWKVKARSRRGEHTNIETLVPLQRYSYEQLKKITKSFAEVLGKGGFGTVYKGILSDGRAVAVKVLKESEGSSGEDFVNEVSSMSRTSHVNIVTLLGFCYQGSKRAVVYEFLRNGSLDKYISSNKSSNKDWNVMYGIALGVARGLEYLHNGCSARVVHFDIKPENVLLDDNFCPKVSDFGLAKLCENQESILPEMEMRGTVGYIAPEIISKLYGRPSHMSDVYSYGMLVLEMTGATKQTSTEQDCTSTTSSMYFPEWIYRDVEKGNNKRLLEDQVTSDQDQEISRKMKLVGLWCIQSSPSDRPAMNRVVEMLEGSLDDLAVPPRPVLQFPLVPKPEPSWVSENSISSAV